MISLEKVSKAAKILCGKVSKTPLIHSPTLSRTFGSHIYLKLENLQKTGSFKIRGATYKLLNCLQKSPVNGVVTASAGNHAQGVALAARHASVPATIVMPKWVSITKQEATRSYGGEVILHGGSVGESLEKAHELASEGLTFIHPFDDPDIIAGQGTIALEIFEEIDDVDVILAPIGGGGLIAGISSVTKAVRPKTKIIGVQAAAFSSAYESFKRGKVTFVDGQTSIADGISVKQVGELNFDIIKSSVDDIVLVDEQQIAAAILMLLERKKILVEGAGAVTLAAFLSNHVSIPGKSKVVLIISGGNVDSPLLGRIISQGMLKHGRIMRLTVNLDDIPGALSEMLALVARMKANVLHIDHDRNLKKMPIYTSRVELELETRGTSHIEAVAAELKKTGYDIVLR